MADLLFVLIVVAFFGLMVLLVKACDRIIGPDEAGEPTERPVGSTVAQEEVVG